MVELLPALGTKLELVELLGRLVVLALQPSDGHILHKG